MQQQCTVQVTIEKRFAISQVQDWINEKIKDSKVTEIRLYNTELIFDGSLNTFLGDIDVLSLGGISKDELNKLFRTFPYWIHEFVLKYLQPECESDFMRRKTILAVTSKHPHIIDEIELNRLMANFSKNIADQIAAESCDYICSDCLDTDAYYTKHTRKKFPHNIVPPRKLE